MTALVCCPNCSTKFAPPPRKRKTAGPTVSRHVKAFQKMRFANNGGHGWNPPVPSDFPPEARAQFLYGSRGFGGSTPDTDKAVLASVLYAAGTPELLKVAA